MTGGKKMRGGRPNLVNVGLVANFFTNNQKWGCGASIVQVGDLAASRRGSLAAGGNAAKPVG